MLKHLKRVCLYL